MTIARTAACLLAGAALLSACSKPAAAPTATADPVNAGPPAAASGASKGPCELMTRTDAEAAVGAALPQNSVNPTLGTCGWTSTDFGEGAQLTVGTWDSIKAAATSGAKPPAAVGEVGDEALYFTGQETGGGPLYVRRGAQGFLLVLNGSKIDHLPGADALATEKALALKILARM